MTQSVSHLAIMVASRREPIVVRHLTRSERRSPEPEAPAGILHESSPVGHKRDLLTGLERLEPGFVTAFKGCSTSM